VRVVHAALRWQVVAFGLAANASSLAAMRDAAHHTAAAFDYASVVLIGAERGALLVRAAAAAPPDPSHTDAIDRIFELDGRDVARYDDPTRAIARRVRVADGKLAAVRLSGDPCGEAWLREWLTEERDVAGGAGRLLLPSAQPPGGRPLRGRVVCNCFNVSEAEIESRCVAFACAGDRALQALQAELKCGTGCGSCLPEVRRMLGAPRRPAELALQ